MPPPGARPARSLLAAGLLAALLLSSALIAGALPAKAQPAGLAVALLEPGDLPAPWRPAPSAARDVTENIEADGYCDADDGVTYRPAALAVAAFDQRPQPRTEPADLFDDDSPIIFHVVARFSPGEGGRAFACLRADLADDFRPSDNNLAALALPPYGDERYAIRIEERSAALAARLDVVMVRRGDLISVLLVIDIGAPRPAIPADLTLTLAAIADLRLANASKK